MAGHVAERAGAEVPPAAPDEVAVGAVVRTVTARSEPEVEAQWRRDRLDLLGRLDALRPHRAIGPHVHLAHRADRTAAHRLDTGTQAVHAGALVAHLRDHAMTRREHGQLTRLLHRMRERLLAEHVETASHRTRRRHRVHVIGRADHHRIESALTVEQLAQVLVATRLREGLEELRAARRVDVAQRDHLLALHGHAVRLALAAAADHGDADLVEAAAAHGVAAGDRVLDEAAGTERGGGAQDATT